MIQQKPIQILGSCDEEDQGCPSEKPVENLEIVNGVGVDITLQPFQVSLHLGDLLIGGGSLISPVFVLTAAHCIEGYDPTEFFVRLGSTKYNTGGFLVDVIDGEVHPKYSKPDYDVAYLKLSTPMNIPTRRLDIITLVPVNFQYKVKSTVFTSGWGLTKENATNQVEILRRTSLTIYSDQECAQVYSIFTNRMICAGSRSKLTDTCQGDSGGPLFWIGQDNNRKRVFRLWGIISFGTGCARKNTPGGYTRIGNPEIRRWIRSKTGK